MARGLASSAPTPPMRSRPCSAAPRMWSRLLPVHPILSVAACRWSRAGLRSRARVRALRCARRQALRRRMACRGTATARPQPPMQRRSLQLPGTPQSCRRRLTGMTPYTRRARPAGNVRAPLPQHHLWGHALCCCTGNQAAERERSERWRLCLRPPHRRVCDQVALSAPGRRR